MFTAPSFASSLFASFYVCPIKIALHCVAGDRVGQSVVTGAASACCHLHPPPGLGVFMMAIYRGRRNVTLYLGCSLCFTAAGGSMVVSFTHSCR